jgi:uncharacterized protein DUF4124
VAVGTALMLASTGWAGEVYRWTDAQGVLHIADLPPPQGRDVQKQAMPESPAHPMVAVADATPASGTPGAAAGATPPAGTPAAGGEAGTQGPARVVITERNEDSLGDTKHAVSGTVENKGGDTAHDVAIAVHVTSPAQGDECLEEEIQVASALKPGEKAEFSADLDHPCFRGPTQVDLRAQWQ